MTIETTTAATEARVAIPESTIVQTVSLCVLIARLFADSASSREAFADLSLERRSSSSS